jgi:hypothetical protein
MNAAPPPCQDLEELKARPFVSDESAERPEAILLYPEELLDRGGAVVTSARVHQIWINSPSTPPSAHWGDPSNFLHDLFGSHFIHIVDQYMKKGEGCPSLPCTAKRRYKVDSVTTPVVIASPPNPLLDSDIRLALVTAVHQLFPDGGGGGYGHVYNIFLPKGQDLCSGATHKHCYAPNGHGTRAFCAYHSSFDTVDNKGAPLHLLYTAEPFQDAKGCSNAHRGPPGPNGSLIDSTVSTLSHEMFELITDPDVGRSWVQADKRRPSRGQEIGDLCDWWTYYQPGYRVFQIGSKKYKVQYEYSNRVGACTQAP